MRSLEARNIGVEESEVLIRFGLLSSGSSGNALLITSGSTKILIDSGLSFKQLGLRAKEIREGLDGLKAVFVTHEHSDHVTGIGPLARKLNVPVYITPKTFECLPASIGILPQVVFFEPGETIAVDGLALTSYSVCHDAADPVSFVIESGGVKLGIASDLGHVSQLVKSRLAGSQGLVLESNYCPEMLKRGPYPVSLKQRIKSKHGHLSNFDMNSLLEDLINDALQVVVLAHLSEENNAPEYARDLAARVLDGHPAQLHVALQKKPTPMFEIRP